MNLSGLLKTYADEKFDTLALEAELAKLETHVTSDATAAMEVTSAYIEASQLMVQLEEVKAGEYATGAAMLYDANLLLEPVGGFVIVPSNESLEEDSVELAMEGITDTIKKIADAVSGTFSKLVKKASKFMRSIKDAMTLQYKVADSYVVDLKKLKDAEVKKDAIKFGTSNYLQINEAPVDILKEFKSYTDFLEKVLGGSLYRETAKAMDKGTDDTFWDILEFLGAAGRTVTAELGITEKATDLKIVGMGKNDTGLRTPFYLGTYYQFANMTELTLDDKKGDKRKFQMLTDWQVGTRAGKKTKDLAIPAMSRADLIKLMEQVAAGARMVYDQHTKIEKIYEQAEAVLDSFYDKIDGWKFDNDDRVMLNRQVGRMYAMGIVSFESGMDHLYKLNEAAIKYTKAHL